MATQVTYEIMSFWTI